MFQLIAATFAPMREDSSLNLDLVPDLVDHLHRSGVTGVFVNGTTGEGMSLSCGERRAILAAYAGAAKGRLRVVAQVGHDSLAEAKGLAEHAAAIGVDAISATPPTYFPIARAHEVIAFMAEVAAAAPSLPFYYYHIPSLTDVDVDMLEFLRLAPERIPTFRGLKYSDTDLSAFLACLRHDGGRFEMLYGCDESLLGALAVGVRGAVGSTYNFAAPLYREMIAAFDRGDMDAAREWQAKSVPMVRAIMASCGRAGLKATMSLLGLDCGPMRLPNISASPGQVEELRQRLDAIGFFEWSRPHSLTS